MKRIRRRRLVMAAAIAAGLVAGVAGPAGAQVNVVRAAVGEPGGSVVSARDLDRYSKLLGLDEAQREAGKALLEAYRADYDGAAKERREKGDAIREEFQETKDFAVMEQMGDVMRKFSERSQALEKAFFADLKALLTEQQAAKWPKLERTRRRDTTLSRGSLSGESVDLVQVVEHLELADQAALAEALEQYEVDLDRALVERNRIMEEEMKEVALAGRGGALQIDLEGYQKRLDKVREAGEKVREVNQRHARVMEGLLPGDRVAEFQAAVKRQSYPQVYRQARVQRALEAAARFKDLTAEQTEAITALRATYEREAGPVNDRWVDAINEEEKTAGGPMTLAGGTMLMIGTDENEGPIAKARQARRDLDKKTMESLEAILSDDQKSRLPKGGEAGSEGAVGGIQIIRER
jgi:hypothetical protein